MATYDDKIVTIKQSRLISFDGGYGLAPVIDAIVDQPSSVTYQIRTALGFCNDFCIQKKSDVAILFLGDFDSPLSLIIAYYTNRKLVEFYLSNTIKGNKNNSLVKELAANLINVVNEEPKLILDNFIKTKRSHRVAFVDANQESNLSLLVPSFSEFKLDLLLIINFGITKTDPFYFHLKEMGYGIHELADGLGIVLRF